MAKEDKKVLVQFHIRESIKQKMRDLAKKDNRSLANWIEGIILKEF